MSILRSKFRGCLLGALFGDALGAKFECDYWDSPVPSERLCELSKGNLTALKASNGRLSYTDDTAMTKVICRSLLANKSLNVNELAKGFVEEYFKEPNRGYGSGVVTVFEKLQEEKYEDVFVPAREQFEGSGSYGNGAAMRVSPLAPFYHDDLKSLEKSARESALITHAHILGVHGAILQAVAVYEALNTAPGSLDVLQYIDKMINVAQELEANQEQCENRRKMGKTGENKESDDEQRSSYVTRFEDIKKMILNNEDDLVSVIKTLGHGVSALEAVPAAIFSFLCKANTCFKDAIFYAISLGGDTDTIAGMTGAIAGAYWGDQSIPEEWTWVTESVEEVSQLADQLYELRAKEELS